MASRQIKNEMEYTNNSKSLIGTKKLDWIPIILSAILLAYWWQPWIYLTATSSLLLILNFLIVGALLLWADGYEREPAITITWSILWGCLVAISITSLITPGEASLFVAAIVEEASKLLGLFWIYKRGSIHSATDALVMGGFIGLGFTIFEDFAYSAGSEEATSILIFRAIFSVFAHTLFSGVGAAIMYLLWKKLHGGGLVLGFIFSYLIHYIWNLSLSIDLASISPLIYFIVYAAWPPVVLLITCILVRQREAAHLRSNGLRAIELEMVSQHELDQILSWSTRHKAAKETGSRFERRLFHKNLHVTARRILELDSYSKGHFHEESTSIKEETEKDPWS